MEKVIIDVSLYLLGAYYHDPRESVLKPYLSSPLPLLLWNEAE